MCEALSYRGSGLVSLAGAASLEAFGTVAGGGAVAGRGDVVGGGAHREHITVNQGCRLCFLPKLAKWATVDQAH